MDKELFALVNSKIIPLIPNQSVQMNLLTIVQVVLVLIELFKKCHNLRQDLQTDSNRVLRTIQNPNLINKARLYLALKRQARKAGTTEQVDMLMHAILQAAKTATKEDVATIYAAIDNQNLVSDES